ncbi:MAG: response regulator, partial [Synergistota bacterium]|nr:response regulator [Synergistota bacterium]
MEKKFTALVCDDSAVVRKIMNKILSEGPFKAIHEANDGVQAVDMYREHRPDIVFLDIVMPGKTGIQALSEIRELDPSARVVMASSTGTTKNLKAAIDFGAVDFIQKPFEK